jgi:monoamine oxidase
MNCLKFSPTARLRPCGLQRRALPCSREASQFDVAVIGAGAAGLAPAAGLLDTGRSGVVLEVRERVGGVWSRREAGFPAAIELGAEFIHGHATTTRALLEKAGATGVDASGSQ